MSRVRKDLKREIAVVDWMLVVAVAVVAGAETGSKGGEDISGIAIKQGGYFRETIRKTDLEK